ncbi:hypothetical protein BBF96_07555 [Anoxybacter fermentans]|uniref:Uncharacterized protein n=1 Tax=Anoxybacter fermentans TaxID=1323375 RepID=A0A3S9SY33_9FIRM|nr:hypothetical protein [Anoxybacter fermentans]AZR73253.1 hypothetical protein BBF96_07555 [Anoxybacter fermentans]
MDIVYVIIAVIIVLAAMLTPGFIDKVLAEEPSLVNLSHLNYLNERVTIEGIEMAITHIYADAPDYKWTDAKGEGVACLDDTARAAVVYLKHYEKYQDQHSLKMARLTLEFVLYMQAPDGEFYNFVNKDLSINKDGPTSFKTYSWWAARAVWALGYGYKVFHKLDPQFATRLEQALKLAIKAADFYRGKYNTYINLHGYKIPNWLIRGEADISAITLLGLTRYYEVKSDPAIKEMIYQLAEGIAKVQYGSINTYPFGRHSSRCNSLSEWHGWGSRQTQALALAGRVLNNDDWIQSARLEAEGWFSQLIMDGFLYESTPAPVRYEQIAYAVNVVVQGYIELYNATGEEKYAQLAGLAATWYLGNNPVKVQMYDPATGRCYDGIDSPETYNANSGAESTIEALLSIIEVENNPIAREYLQYTQKVVSELSIYIEGELGIAEKGQPRVRYGNSGGGQGKFSGNQFIALGDGDEVKYNLYFKNDQKYLIYLIYEKQAVAKGEIEVEIYIDGELIGAIDQGSSPDSNYLWMSGLKKSVSLTRGNHVLSLIGNTDKSFQNAKIDQIVLQPVVETVTLKNKYGQRIQICKDFEQEKLEIYSLQK